MAVISQKDIVKVIESSIDNLQVVVDSVAKNIGKITRSANAANLQSDFQLFNKIAESLTLFVTAIDGVIKKIPVLNFPRIQVKMTLSAIGGVIDIIFKFMEQVNSDKLKEFDNKESLARIEKIKTIIGHITDIFVSVSKMIKYSLLVMTMGWIVLLAIKVIIRMTTTIIRLSSMKVSESAAKKIETIKSIFDGIHNIMKKIIIMIPLSGIASIGLIAVIAFVLYLCLVVSAISLLSNVMKQITKNAIQSIEKIDRVFKAILRICKTILVLALIAPIVAVALVIAIIPLFLILMLTMAIMAVVTFVTRKLSRFARKQTIRIAFDIILICAIFIIMCVAIFLAGLAGMIIVESGMLEYIAMGFIAMATVFALIIVVGKVVSKMEKHLIKLQATLTPLLIALGLLVACGLLIVEFGVIGQYIVENLNNIIVGLVSIIIVSAIVTLLSTLLSKVAKYMAIGIPAILVLAVVMGLLLIAGIAIVAFGKIGKYIVENLVNIIIGLVGTIIISALVVLLGIALSEALPYMLMGTPVLILLAVVMGLLMVAGLTIIGFGKIGIYLEENWLQVIFGFTATITIAGIMVVLGIALTYVVPYLTIARVGILSLVIIIGLLMVSGFTIIGFGKIGTYLEENWLQVIFGFTATIKVAEIVVILGMALTSALPWLLLSTYGAVALAIVVGLLVTVGLAILKFGEIGEYLSENFKYVLIGFASISAAALAMTALGIVLSIAASTMSGVITGALLMALALGLVILVAIEIVRLSEEDLQSTTPTAIENLNDISTVGWRLTGLGFEMVVIVIGSALVAVGALIMSLALGLVILVAIEIIRLSEENLQPATPAAVENLNSVSTVGWRLAGLGFEMVAIVIGCALLVTLIQPILVAIFLTTVAVLAIEQISEAKIDNTKVSDNIGSIKYFWITFKKFIEELSAKDLFLFTTSIVVTLMIASLAIAVENIANRLNKISTIELNETAILNNVEKIFNCINDLAAKIKIMLMGPVGNSPLFNVPKKGFFSFFKKKKPTAKDKLDNVKRILATLAGIAVGLNEIQKFTLNEDAILKNVDSIFKFISKLATYISANLMNTSVFNNKIVKKSTWWGGVKKEKEKNKAIEKLDNVSKVTEVLKKIISTLEKIQKFNVDKDVITGKITELFGFIQLISDEIVEHLSKPTPFDDVVTHETTWWGGEGEKVVEKNNNLKRLDNVSKVIGCLSSITSALSSIQKLKINKDKIQSTITDTFNFVGQLISFIDKNSSSLAVLEDKVTWKWVEGGWFSSGHYEKQVEKNQTAKAIADVEKIVSSMGKIMETLKLLSEVTLNDDIKNKINTNIKEIFNYISEITIKVDDLLNPKTSNKGVLSNNANAEKSKNIANALNENASDYIEKLGSVGQIFTTLSDIMDSIKKIKEIEVKQKDIDTITRNINFLFGSVNYISGQIQDQIDSIPPDGIDTEALDTIVSGLTSLTDAFETLGDIKLGDFEKNAKTCIKFLNSLADITLDENKANAATNAVNAVANFISSSNRAFNNGTAEKRLKFMERLNTVVTALGNVSPEHVNRSQQIIRAQISYLDKINSIDISKLKTSARMVESMAKLSRSIRGNFEGLAESINEDLMPVLKELKEIMEKIPEKLDTGFQSTNASIGAVNAPPTSENLSNQVKRENPTLTAEDVDRIVRQRLTDVAKNNAVKNINDIYNVLIGNGYSGVKIQP